MEPRTILEAQEATLARFSAAELRFKTCEECGRRFSTNLITEVKGHVACAECKARLFQKLSEGLIRRRDFRRNYASFWTRGNAFLIDATYSWIPAFLGGEMIVFQLEGSDRLLNDLAIWLLAFGAVRVVLDTWLISYRGATFGQRMKGMKVVTDEGKLLSVKCAFYRSLWTIVSMPLGFGFYSVLTDNERRALADRMCGTRVVLVRK